MSVSLTKGANVSLTKQAPDGDDELVNVRLPGVPPEAGQGYASGLGGIARDFGVNVG